MDSGLARSRIVAERGTRPSMTVGLQSKKPLPQRKVNGGRGINTVFSFKSQANSEKKIRKVPQTFKILDHLFKIAKKSTDVN